MMRARNAGAMVRLMLILALTAGALLNSVALEVLPATTSSDTASVRAMAKGNQGKQQNRGNKKESRNKDKKGKGKQKSRKKAPAALDSKRIAVSHAEALAAFECSDLDKIRVGDRTYCTHGEDSQEAIGGSGEADAAAATARTTTATTRALCIDDGQSGPRVQLVYIHRNDKPNRLSELLPTFRRLASEMDTIVDQSARKTGSSLRIRFVTNNQCQVDVASLSMPESALRGFSATIGKMKDAGYDELDRKYLMLVDADAYCGVGTFFGNDKLGSDTHNFTGYARVDKICWDAGTMIHELSHTLGAVQFSAPHTSRGAHCIDEWDVMCYRDEPHRPKMKILCKDGSEEFRLDCNNDDYFAAKPKSGSYLAKHWNIADSIYLTGGTGESCVDAKYEPDDAYWYAFWKVPMRKFKVGESEEHAFCDASGDTDWVLFQAKRGKTYLIETTNLGPDVDTQLVAYRGFEEQDWEGMTQIAFNDDREDGDPSSLLTFTAARDGSYLIGISEAGSRAGYDKTYTVSIKEGATARNGNLTLSRKSAKPKGGFAATMHGLDPGVSVIFWWERNGNARELGETVANDAGEASGSYTVPKGAKKGLYQIEAIASDNTYATAEFRVDIGGREGKKHKKGKGGKKGKKGKRGR